MLEAGCSGAELFFRACMKMPAHEKTCLILASFSIVVLVADISMRSSIHNVVCASTAW